MAKSDTGEAITETLGVVGPSAMVWKWVRRRSLVQWALLAMLGLMVIGYAPLLGLSILVALFVGISGAALANGVRAKAPRREIRASLDGLAIEGRRAIPAQRLLSATIAKIPEGFQVDVVRRWGLPIRMVTSSAAQARRVVDALGLGLDRRVFSTRILSPIVGMTGLVVGTSILFSAIAAIALADATGRLSIAAWFLGVACAVVLSNLPTRLRVGRDAIESRWLGWHRALRIADVERLEVLPRTWRHPHRVRVHPRRGAPIDLPISQVPRADPAGFEAASRVVERIEAAMHAPAPDPDPRFSEWNRSRAALGPDAWLEALRPSDRAYRTAAMPFDAEALASVLDDPHGELEDRAGAAVALGARMDDALKKHLLDVSRATAQRELASVLEAVRRGDDAALRRALAKVPRVRVEVRPVEDEPEGERVAAPRSSARARLMR